MSCWCDGLCSVLQELVYWAGSVYMGYLIRMSWWCDGLCFVLQELVYWAGLEHLGYLIIMSSWCDGLCCMFAGIDILGRFNAHGLFDHYEQLV